MIGLWLACAVVLIFLRNNISRAQPVIELEHNPERYTKAPSREIEGTELLMPLPAMTPDFRFPEPKLLPRKEWFYREENRPYRLSPHRIATGRWEYYDKKDSPGLLGCACCTVYKRLIPLAGCVVLTTRHILTTASSTNLILKDRKDLKNLEDILGAWYDHDKNVKNSSMYMTPARIHYHPRFLRPENVNRSHPIPGYFDLALWASTYPFVGWFLGPYRAVICGRSSSHRYEYGSPVPEGQLLFVVGFQFIWAWNRKPMPWFKYAIKTRAIQTPCPKTEWGWYLCVPGAWASLGVESGASLHRSFQGWGWKYDGLLGLNMFSMKLRSDELLHYFHPLDTHVVLDWLYSTYMGRQPYEYLDNRFYDSKGQAPRPKPWYRIPWSYPMGKETYNYPYN